MSLELSGNGVVTGLNSVGSSDLGTVLGSKLDLAGGKILQIVRATASAGQRSTTSTSFVDVADMSVTITPQKPDSAILVLASLLGLAGNSNGLSAKAEFGISDSSNNLLSGAEESHVGFTWFSGSNRNFEIPSPVLLIARATPATTSAVTYKTRFRASGSAGATAFARNQLQTAQMYAIEVSA